MPQTREHVLLARQVDVPVARCLPQQMRLGRRPRAARACSKWKFVSCLSQYDFPGEDMPIIRGAAKPAYDNPGDEAAISASIDELIDAIDSYIPEPEREDVDKPFLMAIEDVFSIEGRGTVATGRIESVASD